jgi:polysaccharide biosynthesis transport protein
MNPKPPTPPPALLISARDIYYVLFRHKWMIGIIAVIAIVASMVLRQFYPIYYTSEAKLLVKYVVDTKPLTAEGADAQVTPMNTGDTILTAEQEMLTSLDVCEQVARIIGPGKILPAGDGTNETAAAQLIQHGLVPTRDRNSDVLRVYFSHPDRDIVVPVLSKVISCYEIEHDEVRRPKSSDDVSRGIDAAKEKVTDAEIRLREERTKADIVSLDDSKRAVAMNIEKTETELDGLETDIEVESMILSEMRKGLPASTPSLAIHGGPAATGAATQVTPAIAQEYRTDAALLASLRAKELDLLSWTTTNNPTLQSVQSQITTTEARCRKLVEQHPGLVAIAPTESSSTASDPMSQYNRELIKAETLAVRYKSLTNQLAAAKTRQARIVVEEGPILDLQREDDRYRANLDYYQKRQGEAELDAILEPGNSQISLIEAPTPPAGDFAKVNKTCAAVLFGGLFLALALPFVIEFYLDQTLKRPLDIQSRLGVPFFVTMPKLKAKAQRGALPPEKKVALLPANAGEVPPPESSQPTPSASPSAQPAASGNGHIAPWEQRHALRPFFETLRDRLMTYFEVINLTHKPKLVAVTSCGEGAGVTTTAAGLASALSETGDGNVLLVNMNVQDGEAHHFYRGKLTCGLEEALEKDKRNAACIQGNLFIAKDQDINENLPRVLPKRFSHLVPKMRASDYDYIIFDMPPMSQISITPRLARYMDMVLMVIESEKTDREAAKRATNLLLESKTNVGVVLNKSRDPLPRRLQQDI